MTVSPMHGCNSKMVYLGVMRNLACGLGPGFSWAIMDSLGKLPKTVVRSIFLLSASVLLLPLEGVAQSLPGVAVAWNANTEADVAGYRVYYGGQSGVYTNKVTVGKVTSARVESLIPGGTYYLAMKAFNGANFESPFSTEVVYRVPGSLKAAPTLDALASITVGEDSGLHAVYLSGITAGGGESQPLAIRATSSNPGIVPAPRLYYHSPDDYGWLVYDVAPNASGTNIITVTVDDGQAFNHILTRTFAIVVLPNNDAPVISGIPNQILREDTPSAAFTFTVGDLESPAQDLIVTARSSNPALIPNEYILMEGSG